MGKISEAELLELPGVIASTRLDPDCQIVWGEPGVQFGIDWGLASHHGSPRTRTQLAEPLATVAFVPGSLLTLAAGAIFGLAKGTLLVFIGATLGTAAAFLIARYAARSAIERKLQNQPKFADIDRAVSKAGFKIVFLMRLSPAFPYNLLNYALGMTSVKFRDYLLASFGMLPGTFLYVYYGKVLGSLAALSGEAPVDGGIGKWAMVGVGFLATVAVTTVITRIAKRALKEEVTDDETS